MPPSATGSNRPSRGEIWLASFGAAREGEPGKNRPAVILSIDDLSTGSGRDLVVVVPLSSSATPTPLTPIVSTGEGVDAQSVAVCRAVRSIARRRLIKKVGTARRDTLRGIEHSLGLILGLE